jgi:hypothetical protein
VEPSGYIMMVVVLTGVWGGFVYFLYQVGKQDR